MLQTDKKYTNFLINKKNFYIEESLKNYCQKNRISKRNFKKYGKHEIFQGTNIENFYYKNDLILQINNKDFYCV